MQILYWSVHYSKITRVVAVWKSAIFLLPHTHSLSFSYKQYRQHLSLVSSTVLCSGQIN